MNRFVSLAGVAALLVTGSAAHAQHHGGMSGGAYHGGNMGSYHGGSMGGAYHGGYNGYHGGYGGYGYRGGYGYGGYGYPGFGLYLGLGGLGYGGYGAYSDGYPYGFGSDPAYNYPPAYAVPPAYGQAPTGQMQTQSSYAPSAGAARVVIRVPSADAQVWVDDYQVTQTGPVRALNTPAVLEPGKPYHYIVKAQWTEDGKPVTQERRVNVQVGQTSSVDFTQPGAR